MFGRLLVCFCILHSVVGDCVGTIVGTSVSTEGSLAIDAGILMPGALALDAWDNVYFASAHQVWMIMSNGRLTLVAGEGPLGYNGDGMVATSSQLYYPTGILVLDNGDILIADRNNHRIRIVYSENATIQTFAGTGTASFSGDGGLPSQATLIEPSDVAIDNNGNIFIVDTGNLRVRMISKLTGLITTVAGCGQMGFPVAGPALAFAFSRPHSLAITHNNDILISDSGNNIVVSFTVGGNGSVIAGGGSHSAGMGDGGPATAAELYMPSGIFLDNDNNIYICDTFNHIIRRIDAHSRIITTFAGLPAYPNFDGDGRAANRTALQAPVAIVQKKFGSRDFVFSDSWNDRLRVISSDDAHVVSTLAGRGALFTGDGVLAARATLLMPQSVVADANGNLFISDSGNNRIRRVDAYTGLIDTIAGNGVMGFNGDGVPARNASLAAPMSAILDSNGDILIADMYNDRIRSVSMTTGIISTIAGGFSLPTCADGMPALSCSLPSPRALLLDSNGDILMSTTNPALILRLNRTSNRLQLVAGREGWGSGGDGGPATAAYLSSSIDSMAFDLQRNIVFGDGDRSKVRIVYRNGTIATIAGTGSNGFSGDGGPAVMAQLSRAAGILVDINGDIFFSDSANNVIRRIFASNRTITTYAGDGQGAFAGDGLDATQASFFLPGALFRSAAGIYVADILNNRIRSIIRTTTRAVGACPTGHSCACGTPVRCNRVDYFCPGGFIGPDSALPISSGYYSIPEDDGALRIMQQVCPQGSYCQGGRRTSCPAGTYGPSPRQAFADLCLPCPPGTYNPRTGAIAPEACLPCPAGAYASEPGSLRCHLCGRNTSNPLQAQTSASACTTCPAEGVSLPGSSVCVGYSGIQAVFQNTMTVSRPAATVQPTFSATQIQAAIIIAIVVTVCVPMVLLWASILVPQISCFVQQRVAKIFMIVDLFDLQHPVAEGAPPVKRSTLMGGALSIAALGIICALVVSLLVQFSLSNTLTQESVLAASLPTLLSMEGLSVAQLQSPFPICAECSSGLTVSVRGFGPGCNAVEWHAAELLSAGGFALQSRYDNRTGAADHLLACPSCLFGPLSSVSLLFPQGCATQHVSVYAADINDAASAVFTNFSLSDNVNTAFVQITPSVSLLDDRISGVKERGISLGATSVDTMLDASVSSGNHQLLLSFATAETYISIQISPIMSTTQLISAIIGLSGIIGAFAIIFKRLEQVCGSRPLRTKSSRVFGFHAAHTDVAMVERRGIHHSPHRVKSLDVEKDFVANPIHSAVREFPQKDEPAPRPSFMPSRFPPIQAVQI